MACELLVGLPPPVGVAVADWWVMTVGLGDRVADDTLHEVVGGLLEEVFLVAIMYPCSQ